MDTNALAKEINGLITTERRSLLAHFTHATPHVDARTYRIWNQVKQLAHRDSDHVGRLSALLTSLHLPERTRPFSQDVGHYHYMSLDRAMHLLIEEKKKQLVTYDRTVRHCAREVSVIDELESLRADNLAELLTLESLAKQLKLKLAKSVPMDPALSPDINNAANAVVAAQALAAAKAQ